MEMLIKFEENISKFWVNARESFKHIFRNNWENFEKICQKL